MEKYIIDSIQRQIPETYTDGNGAHVIPRLFDPTRQRCSTDNSKTGLVSCSLLAGKNTHKYDGYTPACMAALPPVSGSCNCDCVDENGKPACYAKVMTRLPEVFIKFYLNTIEIRIDPVKFFELVENEIFSGPELMHPRMFRINDSGDIDSASYLAALTDMMRRHPGTQYGTYTKRDDIVTPEIIDTLPENLTLSCSPWKDISKPIGNLPQFIYDDGTDPEIAKLPHCPAVSKDGSRTGVKCCRCGHCYIAKPGERWAVYAHGPARKNKKGKDTRK